MLRTTQNTAIMIKLQLYVSNKGMRNNDVLINQQYDINNRGFKGSTPELSTLVEFTVRSLFSEVMHQKA